MDEEQQRTRDDEIVAMLRAEWPELMAVYLFGSAAKGLERPGSDLDIAALGRSVPGKSTPALTRRLGFAMARKLGVDVDLVDLGVASTILQKEVIAEGRRLWTADEFETEMFEIRVYWYYQKLNEERAEIIADGIRTGYFYYRDAPKANAERPTQAGTSLASESGS